MAVPIITTQKITGHKTNIGPGRAQTIIAASFSEGQSTLLVDISGTSDVIDAYFTPVTKNTLDGTAGKPDSFLLVNTINATGVINLIASSTNGNPLFTSTLLSFSRNGSNAQDGIVNVISKG